MNKRQYLGQTEVAQFIDHLASVINGSEPLDSPRSFHYLHAPADFDEEFGRANIAGRLEDLFERYWWRRAYYGTNEALLQTALRGAQTVAGDCGGLWRLAPAPAAGYRAMRRGQSARGN